jgi:hypothetical protein
MQFVKDDAYEYAALAFQAVQVSILNDALKEHGIKDVALRKEICTSFTFFLGDFLDQGWLKTEGVRYFPMICFAEQFPGWVEEGEDLGTVHVSDGFDFHEYAHGVVSSYFDDDKEGLGNIEAGGISELEDDEGEDEDGDEDEEDEKDEEGA